MVWVGESISVMAFTVRDSIAGVQRFGVVSFPDEPFGVWSSRRVKKLSPELSRLAYNKLVLVNAAESINDLRVPPGNRLEKLAGNRAGQYSIRVNDQWRICFTWGASGAGNGELVDYH